MLKVRPYSDDEYYTTFESAEKFFEKVVKPSGILKHKTIVMPFSTAESPLCIVARKHHNNVLHFDGDFTFWQKAKQFDDPAVIDNPPFSMSAKIEKRYFKESIPFILFRSAVQYPKFIFEKSDAGVIYENSPNGVKFVWGIDKHLGDDPYIKENHPNLIDNLKAAGIAEKRVPVGFSFFMTGYHYKVSTVTFSKMRYPKKKDTVFYVFRGVYDATTKIYIDEKDSRVHLISK